MLEVAKNKTSRSTPDEQLYWFVNKVLSIEQITYLPYGEYDKLICFQPNLLNESEFFKFRICTYDPGANDGGIRENRTLIGIMLMKIKSDVEGNLEKFRKDYGLPSEIEYLIWDTESILLDNAIYIDRKYRPVFEAYLRYLDGDKIETEIKDDKKYSEANEDILLKLLGIKIKGSYIIRGQNKAKINPTEKAILYYLFFKSTKNEEECFTLKDLAEAKEIQRAERYIKNSITNINQSIKKIISQEKNLKIKRFIVKENNKRGYHLNPKILLIKSKE